MIETLRKLYKLFTPRERQRLGLVFVAIVITAIIEVAGIASILPFLSIVSDPGMIQENEILNWLYNSLGFQSKNRFLLFSGIVVLVIITLSNVFAAITMWGLNRFAWMRNHTLSRRLLKRYLYSPYSFFLNKNTSELGKNTLDEVRQVINGVLRPGLNMVAKGIVSLAIFALLLFINPWLALLVTAVLGGAYGLIFYLMRRTLSEIGDMRYEANIDRYRSVNEAFGGIKLLKLIGLENSFLSRYTDASFKYSRSRASIEVINTVPRYLIEVIAFGGLLVIILYLLLTGGGLKQVLPLAGLYAFSGYRLKPQIQQVFHGFTSLRYNAPALESLYSDMKPDEGNWEKEVANSKKFEPISLRERLELKSITYAYPGTRAPVLNGVNLNISANSTVAFAGETGSGKTTIVDVILGLLRPDEGKLVVDGAPIKEKNLRAWQVNLGYVPQEIYLNDTTLANNIAFGVPEPNVETERVKQAAKDARIHEFVENQLPDGYDTAVGEKGVRLSGGQKQRIGIARALYRKPDLLVLDEATSDLDTVTERSVYGAIAGSEELKTVIIIAHRLSTLKTCDEIFLVEEGEIISSGTYEELSERSDRFKDFLDSGLE